jgi:hypothetical protein
VNITPPNSGTASAHCASHAQPASSSLADFLLAGAPANSGDDFKTIAAALFGANSSTASPAQPVTTEAKTVTGLSQDKAAARTGKDGDKDKELSDSTTGSLFPGLTIPLQTVHQASFDSGPNSKAETESSTLGLPNVKATLEAAGLFAGLKQTSSDDKLAGASQHRSAPLEAQGTITPPSALNQADSQASAAAIKSPDGKQPLVDLGVMPLVEQPKAAAAVMEAKKTAVRTVPAPTVAAKRAAADGSREASVKEPGSTEPAKTGSVQATNITEPILPIAAPIKPTAAPINTDSNQQAPSVANGTPPALTLDQTSTASAKEVLDSMIAGKDAPQPSSIHSGLAANSKQASSSLAPDGPSKTKDRGIKDTKVAGMQGRRDAREVPGNIADGLTKSLVANRKEVPGLALAAHSDAHAKAVPLKQSVSASSSQAGAVEADAPDEALPTSSPATTAKLVQGISQSEFRVGMQTQEFGHIDIRTSVARHVFSAQISVEHNDIAKSMTADLPALYHKLADQQVSVASIVIQGQQSLATSSGLAQDAQPQMWRPQSHDVTKSDGEIRLPVMTEALDSGGRLDIRI